MCVSWRNTVTLMDPFISLAVGKFIGTLNKGLCVFASLLTPGWVFGDELDTCGIVVTSTSICAHTC